MPNTADPLVPIRNFDDLLIAHQRLISGALREVVRRGDDEGYLGRLVRDLEAAMAVPPAVTAITAALPEKTWVGKLRAPAPVLGGG